MIVSALWGLIFILYAVGIFKPNLITSLIMALGLTLDPLFDFVRIKLIEKEVAK